MDRIAEWLNTYIVKAAYFCLNLDFICTGWGIGKVT